MRISELFYALQGEGPSIGTPAVFVRFAGCNLQCKWCDTLDTWKRGSEMDTAELSKSIIEMAGGIDLLNSRRVHVVITGGEPLLHEKDVQALVRALRFAAPDTYFELETNGTIASTILDEFDQINCSPKLASSFEPLVSRLVPAALVAINKHKNANFKFVLSSAEEWYELESTYSSFISFSGSNIYLMPAALTREELIANSPAIWELAAEKHVKLATRLQTITWSNRKGK